MYGQYVAETKIWEQPLTTVFNDGALNSSIKTKWKTKFLTPEKTIAWIFPVFPYCQKCLSVYVLMQYREKYKFSSSYIFLNTLFL